MQFGDTAHGESFSGSTQTSGDVETSVDEESGEETTTFSADSERRDAATRDDVGVHIEGQQTRDLCWAEDARNSSTTVETTVTRQTEAGPVETTVSTTTTVTADPMGALAFSVWVTLDGYTVRCTISTDDLPQDESGTESSIGNRTTQTYTVTWKGSRCQPTLFPSSRLTHR